MSIKNHPNCIEERARKVFGETEIYSFAGYILEDGSMLNFSYGGYQRDEDHRIVGQFFKNATGTEAMLKFMRRGNVRVMCNKDGYCFEFIKPLTHWQRQVITEAALEAESLNIPFVLEADDRTGRSKKRWYESWEIAGCMFAA